MTEVVRNDLEPMLSIAQVATYIGTSEKVVRTAIKNGKLHATRLGPKTIRIEKIWVDEWIDRNPVKTSEIDYGGLRQAKMGGARRGTLKAIAGGRS